MVVIADESWHVPRMPLKVNVYSRYFSESDQLLFYSWTVDEL